MKKFIVTLCAVALLTGCTCTANNTTLTEPTAPTTEATQSTIDTTATVTETTQISKETVSEAEFSLFKEIAGEYVFSSGAGAWGTIITVSEDGSFEGNYHDSEMGSASEENPNGTVYICNFDGSFYKPEKIDDYTYSMKLETIQQQEDEGVEYIEDGIKYVHSYPAGFEDANKFMVYLPGKPVSELPEQYLTWDPIANDSDTLDHIGLYNVKGKTGFVRSSD